MCLAYWKSTLFGVQQLIELGLHGSWLHCIISTAMESMGRVWQLAMNRSSIFMAILAIDNCPWKWMIHDLPDLPNLMIIFHSYVKNNQRVDLTIGFRGTPEKKANPYDTSTCCWSLGLRPKLHSQLLVCLLYQCTLNVIILTLAEPYILYILYI